MIDVHLSRISTSVKYLSVFLVKLYTFSAFSIHSKHFLESISLNVELSTAFLQLIQIYSVRKTFNLQKVDKYSSYNFLDVRVLRRSNCSNYVLMILVIEFGHYVHTEVTNLNF